MPRNVGGGGPSAAKQPRTAFSPRAANASFTSTTSSADSLSGGHLRHLRDGEIMRIRLSDFMNHAELDLKLSPGVNVITGHNGAGKSSILQAVVLGLGAVAKDTKRGGQNLADFIRHGCQRAEIKVHLFNGGEESYRRETYGKEIVFQRTINPSNSTHVLKDDKGRTVYEKKKATDEKKYILEYFNIELNNPVSILQQEEAKVFFKDSNDRQLYDFFSRATLLKIMQNCYSAGGGDLAVAENYLALKKKDLERQEAEKEEWLKKVEELQTIEYNNTKRKEYKKEMKWMLVEVKEKEKARYESERSEKAGKVEKLRSSLVAAQEEMDRLGGDKEKLSMEVEASKAREEVSRTRIHEAKQAHGQAKRKLEEVKLDIKTTEDDIGMKRRELKELQNEARAKRIRKESKEKDLATKKEELLRQKEDTENLSQRLEDEIGELGQQRSKLQEDLSENKRAFLACKSGLNGFQVRRRELEEELDKLQSASDASGRNLARFGRDMQRLADEVQKAVRSGKFNKPPVGPVGRHVKLRGTAGDNSDLADLLEAELNQRNLNAFLVDNSHDHKVLDTIFKQVYGGRRVPLAVIMKLDCGAINLDRGRVVTNPDMPGVLDFLTFDNDDAFRYIVEETKAEKTIVVTQEKAQALFEQQHTVPRNAEKAITPDFYRYTPNTNRSNYGSTYIHRPHEKHHNLLVCDHRINVERLKAKMDQLDAEIADKTDEFRMSENQQNTVLAGLEKIKDLTSIKRRDKEQAMINLQRVRNELSKLSQGPTDSEEAEALVAEKEKEIQTLSEALSSKKATRREANEDEIKTRKALEGLGDGETLEQGHSMLNDRLKELEKELASKKKAFDKQKRALGTEENALEQVVKNINSTNGQIKQYTDAALKISDNKRISVTKTPEDLKALLADAEDTERKIRARIGVDKQTALKKYDEAKAKHMEMKSQWDKIKKNQTEAEAIENQRKQLFKLLRSSMSRAIQRHFTLATGENDLEGELHISHKNKTLAIMAKPSGRKRPQLQGGAAGDGRVKDEGDDSVPILPLSSLSGGERSKTLVALLLSMWEYVKPPFRCLDEWDVYLDEVSRAKVEKMLYTATTSNGYQHIFISPQKTTLEGVNVLVVGKET